MESRVDRTEKYYKEEFNTNTSLSRSNRNSRLYRQVYGKYQDLDNLPIDDNSDEIDIERLKELVASKDNNKEKLINSEYNLDVLNTRKRNIDQNKIYDINKLLEKAKYENNKLKEPENKIIRKSKDILSTLESTELSVEEIKKACEKYEDINNKTISQEDNKDLTMTRELKYQTKQISIDPLIEQVIPDNNDIALDLLSDLKPTGNTIVTKPIKEEQINKSEDIPFFEAKTTTRDITTIKEEEPTKEESNDFFTSSYQFTQKDFADDDFFDEEPKSHNLLKVILLVLAIIVFAGVIFYFVMNYGIGV